MKKLMLQILWLLAVVAAVAVFTLVFTGVAQVAVEAVTASRGVTIADDVLFTISGTIGTGCAAVVLWLLIRWLKSLRFYRCPAVAGRTWTVAFVVMTVALCKVALPGLWALCVPAEQADTAGDEPVWMMLIFGVLLAPVFEELLFRRDIFSLMLKRFSLGWTVALSALLFAAVHGYSAQGFVSCLVVGLLLGVLMARTGSLWACVAAHMLCNLEAFAFTMLQRSDSPAIDTVNGHAVYTPAIFIAGAVLTIACALWCIRKR